jgi:hypothetical protein
MWFWPAEFEWLSQHGGGGSAQFPIVNIWGGWPCLHFHVLAQSIPKRKGSKMRQNTSRSWILIHILKYIPSNTPAQIQASPIISHEATRYKGQSTRLPLHSRLEKIKCKPGHATQFFFIFLGLWAAAIICVIFNSRPRRWNHHYYH